MDRSANVYQRNHYQIETEMGPSISEYDSDEQQDQNCLNQHSTAYPLLENHYDAIDKDLWEQQKRISLPIFDSNKKNYNNWMAAFMHVLVRLQLQLNTNFYNYVSTFQEKP